MNIATNMKNHMTKFHIKSVIVTISNKSKVAIS